LDANADVISVKYSECKLLHLNRFERFRRKSKLAMAEKRRNKVRSRKRSDIFEENFDDVTSIEDSQELVCLSSQARAELVDLRRCLDQYFAQYLHYWFTFGEVKDPKSILWTMITSIEQCSVPEVLLVLETTKRIDKVLVAKIQEILLTENRNPRLVALLAQLYE